MPKPKITSCKEQFCKEIVVYKPETITGLFSRTNIKEVYLECRRGHTHKYNLTEDFEED